VFAVPQKSGGRRPDSLRVYSSEPSKATFSRYSSIVRHIQLMITGSRLRPSRLSQLTRRTVQRCPAIGGPIQDCLRLRSRADHLGGSLRCSRTPGSSSREVGQRIRCGHRPRVSSDRVRFESYMCDRPMVPASAVRQYRIGVQSGIRCIADKQYPPNRPYPKRRRT